MVLNDSFERPDTGGGESIKKLLNEPRVNLMLLVLFGLRAVCDVCGTVQRTVVFAVIR